MRIVSLTEDSIKDILSGLLKRNPGQYTEYEKTVNDIIGNVREKGDEAVFEYTKKFDKWDIDKNSIRVSEQEINEAYESFDSDLIEVMKRSAANITEYHKKQLQNSWIETKEDGSILGQKVTPIETSGVYVPGGKAAYPSSTLMCIIPAVVAGVNRIVMLTPANSEGKVAPCTLVAAKITGVKEIYKVGGAQAIAAMAFGTESVPKVDKIVGPGNIFVALAKKAVFGYVSIDSVAGPSEILVLADENANPKYVAADLLSQAEHDELASAILITDSNELANSVSKYIDEFVKLLERRDIISKSLDNYGYILVAPDMDKAIEAVNKIASEHVEVMTRDPYLTMTKIKNAGAIFLGEYSSEPLGDYYAGPNHVLPTNGTAKFFSPLGVDAFIKKSSIISYSRDALSAACDDIMRFARSEGLTAHANSIGVRFDKGVM
ncbi:MAG: histidinol dehydrogenase [Lachnospiraceae bacterium]|nr:histidinol dehydrogenase [Lachnospiraceae bacterium]